MGICYIVGAGEMYGSFSPDEGDFVIAADGGMVFLQRLGVAPDFAVGDFDSLGFVPQDVQTITRPRMKDETDMLLAISLGFERGYKEFHIFGGLGGRMDHSLANIQLLSYIASRGGRGYLIGNRQNITAISGGTITFREGRTGLISVFAQSGECTGVSETGLLYKLHDSRLDTNVPLGVSNEFTGAEASISVETGTITIIWNGKFDKSDIVC